MTAGYPPPLTLHAIRVVASSGHDKFEPAINNVRARELLADHERELQRERDRRVEHVQRNHSFSEALRQSDKRERALIATLDKVRAAYDDLPSEPRLDQWLEFGDVIQSALATAGAPDAGEPRTQTWTKGCGWCPGTSECNRSGCKGCADTPPEPKGPEQYDADYLRWCAASHAPESRLLGNMPASAVVAVCDDLAAANARADAAEREIEAMRVTDPEELAAQLIELKALNSKGASAFEQTTARCVQLESDLAAANKRANEADAEVDLWKEKTVQQKNRADAAEKWSAEVHERFKQAEREQARMQKMLDVCNVVHEHNVKLKSERDKLAARVRGLEATKDEAYRERNQLVAFVARVFDSGRGDTAIDGWDPEWHGCVWMDGPCGQMAWHYHTSEAHLFADLPEYVKPWDGHTTPEKYQRLEAAWKMIEVARRVGACP